MGAMALVNAQTLLPSVIQELQGPEWLVALMPVLMGVGFMGPGVFTAHAIARLHRFKPLLLWTGAFQRLAYLAAALVLLFSQDRLACLVAVAGAPLLSGLCGGLSLPAWMQLVARTVPPARRSSLFAWRYVLSSLLGVAAGMLVAFILAHRPGLPGYGLLHLCAFLGLALSFAVFSGIREAAEAAPRDPATGLWTSLRRMPDLILHEPRLLRFVLSSATYGLSGACIPYLAIHARLATGAPASFLGELVSWQMGGVIAGGLLAGRLGDRHGGKLPLQASRLLLVGVCLAAPWIESAWLWKPLFLLFGAAFHGAMVGHHTLSLELLPAGGHSARLAALSFAQLPVVLLAAGIGGLAWHAWADAAFPWLATGSALAAVGALIILHPVPEPRTPSTAPSGPGDGNHQP